MAVNGLLGKKIGMTTLFQPDGSAVPVTVLEMGPCTVVQVKTVERDGYQAAQLAFDELPPPAKRGGKLARGAAGYRGRSEANRPQCGHYEKAGVTPHRKLAEFALADGEVSPGTKFNATMFEIGAKVKVRGTSKGKGFQGVMKRWNFKGQKASHGQKIHRKPASQGATAAGRVFKGSRRPGRMGNKTATVANLTVVQILPERNLLMLKGAVPGPNGGLLRVERI